MIIYKYILFNLMCTWIGSIAIKVAQIYRSLLFKLILHLKKFITFENRKSKYLIAK